MTAELTIERLLSKMHELKASDLHLTIGSPPSYRIAARLQLLECPTLTVDTAAALLQPIIPARLRAQMEAEGGVDFSLTDQQGRFRCNVFRAGGGLHASIRRVNGEIPEFADLHLPPVYEHVASHVHDGLVLICGVTGSGKSSTLAAMVNHINRHQAYNIITIEDPVEYLFQPIKSVISQREVGIDVVNFPTALRSAVRQDPDVIVIGEMRDRETLTAALMAAETGHLVLGTLHTTDTTQSFSRILEFFPAAEQPFIRATLAKSLRATMAQRLLPGSQPSPAVVPATEVLLNTPIVAHYIRESRDEDLVAAIADSKDEGMHTFSDSLLQLVEANLVDLSVAEEYAPNREQLHSRVHGINIRSDGLVSRVRQR
jgi:twitching motility protein PilT